MSNTAEGFIKKMVTREGSGKRGPWALDNILVADAGGEELGWFGLGFRNDVSVAPKCVEGDYLRFEWEPDGQYKNVVKGSARKVKDAPEQQATPTSTAPAAAVTSAVGSTQQNIHYQNSRTAAIELVGLLLEHKALPMTGATTKAGTAARFEEITAAVDKQTVQFYNDLETFRLFETVADAGEIDTGADGQLPDDEGEEVGEDFEDEAI